MDVVYFITSHKLCSTILFFCNDLKNNISAYLPLNNVFLNEYYKCINIFYNHEHSPIKKNHSSSQYSYFGAIPDDNKVFMIVSLRLVRWMNRIVDELIYGQIFLHLYFIIMQTKSKNTFSYSIYYDVLYLI